MSELVAGSRMRSANLPTNNLAVFQFGQLGASANVTCTNAVSNFTGTTIDGTVIPCKKLVFVKNDGGVKSPVLLSGDTSNDDGPMLKAGVYQVHFSCRLNTSGTGSARIQLWLDANGSDAVKVAESRTIISTAVTAEPIEINTTVKIDLDDVTRNKLEAFIASTAASSSVYVASDYKLSIVCLERTSRV